MAMWDRTATLILHCQPRAQPSEFSENPVLRQNDSHATRFSRNTVLTQLSRNSHALPTQCSRTSAAIRVSRNSVHTRHVPHSLLTLFFRNPLA